MIRLRYFASLREALGDADTIDLPAPALTVGALRDSLIARGGAHSRALARERAVRCAVNQVMAGDDSMPVPADAEVAFFPPVTGG